MTISEIGLVIIRKRKYNNVGYSFYSLIYIFLKKTKLDSDDEEDEEVEEDEAEEEPNNSKA